MKSKFIAQEYAAIFALITEYLSAVKQGKRELMKSSFHPAAIVFGQSQEELFAGPAALLFDWFETVGPNPLMRFSISNINLSVHVASVRVDLFDWSGMHMTAMLNLLKNQQDWSIMNKVFEVSPN